MPHTYEACIGVLLFKGKLGCRMITSQYYKLHSLFPTGIAIFFTRKCGLKCSRSNDVSNLDNSIKISLTDRSGD